MARNQPLEERNEQVHAVLEQWTAQDPPERVAQAVLAEFDRAGQARRRSRWMVTAAAVAAGIAIAWNSSPLPEPPSQASEAPFIALPYVVQPAQYEQTEVVRMAVPAAELMAAGFALQADPGSQIVADVLIGQDRRARAVRLVEE